MELTTQNVDAVVRRVLYTREETGQAEGDDIPNGAVVVNGIVTKYAFHPDRLKESVEDIRSMLRQLPDVFHKGTRDGYSFLGACNDRSGRQWTGEHRVMEALFCLGLGVGAVVELMPRDLWSILPGGVPYYGVDTGLEILREGDSQCHVAESTKPAHTS